MSEGKLDILKPFGPSIVKIEIPEQIIFSLNKYVDKILADETKAVELDYGKNLAGNVKQEFKVEEDLLRSTGLANLLANAVLKWIETTDKKKISTFNVLSSWIVRQFENEYNPIHYHSGHISGVGYLKLPNDYGQPFQTSKTKNANGNLSLIHGNKMFNSNSVFEIKPKIGDFYIFPNYLMHAVYPFYGKEERRSISFNALIDESIYNAYE